MYWYIENSSECQFEIAELLDKIKISIPAENNIPLRTSEKSIRILLQFRLFKVKVRMLKKTGDKFLTAAWCSNQTKSKPKEHLKIVLKVAKKIIVKFVAYLLILLSIYF